MTGAAPISINGGTESDDLVSANTSCWFALRRRTRGRPFAPLAPAIRIFIALPCSARFAATRDLLSFLEQVARARRRLLIALPRRRRSYLRGVVRFFSSVSTTKTASSLAGAVVLAFRLTRWMEPGVSYQLSPER